MEEAGNTVRFSPKQHEAIALLARGRTQSDTAETVGIGTTTLTRWMKSPDFRQAIDQFSQKAIARREKTIDTKMAQLELKALETLEGLMNNAEKDSDRIAAARAVLAHQNSRKTASDSATMVNFAGMTLPGAPKLDDVTAGDASDADN